MTPLWIVTVDGHGARLIARNGHALSLVEALDHPAGRLKEHETGSDKPGRSFESHGHGRHGMEKEVTPHVHEMQHFMKVIATRLDHGRQKKEFEQLFLAAEPHLLGMLRDALDKNTAKMIYGSVSKDLQPVRLDDLKTHLRDHLPPA